MSHCPSSALTQASRSGGILMICIALCYDVAMRHIMAAAAGTRRLMLDEMKYIPIMAQR